MATTAGSWPQLLGRLVSGGDLTADDTNWAMDLVMTGEATPAHVAAFVVALRAKGETPAEIRGMADAMLAHARPLEVSARAADVVGTGGDRAGTVNISTMTSIVLAASGTTVVKHGNRSASSKCGTADVLEELGVAIDLPPEGVKACVEELGIGFCFAALFHPAFKHASGPRREIGIPTAFNVLGPLTNPARPSTGLIGCADRRMAPVMAEVFAGRGDSVLLVSGDDGLDEITTTTSTTVWAVRDGTVREERIDPEALGIALSVPEDLQGGDARVNADVVRRLLAGEKGPVRDAVLINTAGALAAYEGPATDLHGHLQAGMERAAAGIDSGSAADLLERWTERSTELARS
ncbi:anthranilate phosphoribosyltransferase [Halopolyspora algeriensis]|uniref:Anthranilate phosphoribosyltransferase n=1 Tax=Halopolyspora algeriensis TaxID=1500506 RepID=A0A368VX22_9ACTN|nr:anthranilate phosphoribosyltransferase [Halopolyspora algeriensis]RCW44063.1 anthranilate phosphoribosyltransferase [Halopolyspora algeriensis]TQM53438.1 anthranilate phosphoribosyltransferase [Halopolyspora algeriensis]